MSVLLYGDDPVTYRRCEQKYRYGLQDWFAWVERNAWERVNTYYKSERPKEIFLVVGQYLTSSYAVAHKKYGSLECEVIIESSIQLPTVVEGNLLGSISIKKAYADSGFEYMFTKSEDEDRPKYSIILDTYKSKSGPLQRLKRNLKTRVKEQYQYTTISILITNDIRFFLGKKGGRGSLRPSTRSGFIKLPKNGTQSREKEVHSLPNYCIF